jgi:hypothetical protein
LRTSERTRPAKSISIIGKVICWIIAQLSSRKEKLVHGRGAQMATMRRLNSIIAGLSFAS